MVTEVTFVLPRNEKDLPVPLLMLIVSISLLSNKIEISEETSAKVTLFDPKKISRGTDSLRTNSASGVEVISSKE